MIVEESRTDVTLIPGDNIEFRAHEIVLSSCSPAEEKFYLKELERLSKLPKVIKKGNQICSYHRNGNQIHFRHQYIENHLVIIMSRTDS